MLQHCTTRREPMSRLDRGRGFINKNIWRPQSRDLSMAMPRRATTAPGLCNVAVIAEGPIRRAMDEPKKEAVAARRPATNRCTRPQAREVTDDAGI